MINKVSFMGREACLTGSLKKAAPKVEEFIGDGAILKDAANKAETLAKETVAIGEAYKAAHAPFLEKATRPLEKAENAYKEAHAPYVMEVAPKEADIYKEAYKEAHGVQ